MRVSSQHGDTVNPMETTGTPDKTGSTLAAHIAGFPVDVFRDAACPDNALAWCLPDTNQVYLGERFPGDMGTRSGRRSNPHTLGALAHEVAHLRAGDFNDRAEGLAPNEAEWFTLLEEKRIELLLTRAPQHAWLAFPIANMVLDMITPTDPVSLAGRMGDPASVAWMLLRLPEAARPMIPDDVWDALGEHKDRVGRLVRMLAVAPRDTDLQRTAAIELAVMFPAPPSPPCPHSDPGEGGTSDGNAGSQPVDNSEGDPAEGDGAGAGAEPNYDAAEGWLKHVDQPSREKAADDAGNGTSSVPGDDQNPSSSTDKGHLHHFAGVDVAARAITVATRTPTRETRVAPPGSPNFGLTVQNKAAVAAGQTLTRANAARPWATTRMDPTPVKVGVIADVSGSMSQYGITAANVTIGLGRATERAGGDCEIAAIAFSDTPGVLCRFGERFGAPATHVGGGSDGALDATIEMLSMFSEMQRPVPTLDMIVMITDWAVPAAPKVRSLLDRSGIHWVDWGHRRNPMGLPGAIAAQIRSLR